MKKLTVFILALVLTPAVVFPANLKEFAETLNRMDRIAESVRTYHRLNSTNAGGFIPYGRLIREGGLDPSFCPVKIEDKTCGTSPDFKTAKGPPVLFIQSYPLVKMIVPYKDPSLEALKLMGRWVQPQGRYLMEVDTDQFNRVMAFVLELEEGAFRSYRRNER